MLPTTQDFDRFTVLFDRNVCAERALIHGMAMASLCKAELQVLHVVDRSDASPDSGEAGQEVETAVQEVKRATASHLTLDHPAQEGRPENDQVTYQAVDDSPVAPALLDAIHQQAPDAVIMGRCGGQCSNAPHVGGAADEVLRRVPDPILTIGPTGGRVPGFAQRLLVPVDFSESSQEALRFAKQLGYRFDMQVDLLHVIETLVEPDVVESTPGMGGRLTSDEKAHQRLRKLAVETVGPPASIEVHTAKGHPAQEIGLFAKRHNTHLIVQGSGALPDPETDNGEPLGSVAIELLSSASCPVFTVKADGTLEGETSTAVKSGMQAA